MESIIFNKQRETNITCSFSYAALSFLCEGVYGNKIVWMPGNQKVVHKGRKEALGETSSKDNRTRVRGECKWGHWGKGWWEIVGREMGRRGGGGRDNDNSVGQNVFKSFQYHEGEMVCGGGLFTPLILSLKQCRHRKPCFICRTLHLHHKNWV